jgi:hypothetical protein
VTPSLRTYQQSASSSAIRMSALEAAKSFQQLAARRDAQVSSRESVHAAACRATQSSCDEPDSSLPTLPPVSLQSTLFRDLSVYQSTYSAVRSSLEETSDAGNEQSLQQQQEKLREAYQRAYSHAVEEGRFVKGEENGAACCLCGHRELTSGFDVLSLSRLHNECLAHVKSLLRKRDRNAMHTDDYASSDAHGAHNPYAHDPLYIWHHDSTRTLPIGSEVAALVDGHSQPPLWIQCVIKAYRPGSVSSMIGSRKALMVGVGYLYSSARRLLLYASQRPKYECLDLDTGDNPSSPAAGESAAPVRRKSYWLDEKKVLPLPTLQEVPVERRREFAKGERVIAVFPTSGITTLYPAVVVAPPSKRGKSSSSSSGGVPSYSLMFDDDEENTRTVSAQFVAPLIEMPEDDD